MNNPFEQGAQKLVPAVLIYLQFEGKMLMVHRIHKDGKWNGLGGKCEIGESPLQAAMRELREESGIEVPFNLFFHLGWIQFPCFREGQDWLVFMFLVELPKNFNLSEVLYQNSEGVLSWIDLSQLEYLDLWPGDLHFLPFVLEKEPFFGTIWYEKKLVQKYWIQPFFKKNEVLSEKKSLFINNC